MNNYEKPVVQVNESAAEGVYAASGKWTLCDSEWMNGLYQAPDSTASATDGYKKVKGCEGCRAYSATGCLIANVTKEEYDAYWVYDNDKGYRKPSWEGKNYGPYDEVVSETNPDY